MTAARGHVLIVGAGPTGLVLANWLARLAVKFRIIDKQLMINYRHSQLSTGKAGEVHGGDRLPWVKTADNYGSLAEPSWQVHVYGSASQELTDWCKAHDLPLHVFDWRKEHAAVGFLQNAIYLIRPDTYVALAESTGSPEALEIYFKDRGWDR